MTKQIYDSLADEKYSKSDAVAFLDKVVGRGDGDIESPVLEYLLAVKYSGNPAAEYTDGFKSRFSTQGHPKAQGVVINMQLPKSWVGEEAERPHIVRKWRSANGTGYELIMLLVNDAGGYSPTDEEMKTFISSGEVKSVVPATGKYESSGVFHLEGLPGFWVEYTDSQERAGKSVYQKIRMNNFFLNGKSINLMCQIPGIPQDSKSINESFKKLIPLCSQVLNSIVIPSRY